VCSFSRSFTSRCQICDRTNIGWVAIENPRILLQIWCYFTAIQRILMRSQIWKREVEEHVTLQNLRFHHVTIHWDIGYLIRTKVAGTMYSNRSQGTTHPKNWRFMSGPGDNPAKTKRDRFLGGSETEPDWTTGRKPRPLAGYPDPLVTLTGSTKWRQHDAPRDDTVMF